MNEKTDCKKYLVQENIEVSIITVKESLPFSLKGNWKEPNQIITYLHKGNLSVAIDNLLGRKAKNNCWTGKNYIVGEKTKVNIYRNSGFDWIEKLF